jgi:glycine betaine/proline transport system permease protein
MPMEPTKPTTSTVEAGTEHGGSQPHPTEDQRQESRTSGHAVATPRRGFSIQETWKARYVLPVLVVITVVFALAAPAIPFPDSWRLPLGREVARAYEAFVDGGAWFYEPIADQLGGAFDVLQGSLTLISAPVFAAAIVLVVGLLRGPGLALFAAVTIAWLVLTELWEPTVETVAFMIVAVVASTIAGVALGIIGAGSPRAESAVTTLVDVMQAFPAFAYMVPAVVLLGVGNPAALLVTIIWAAPPLARMTSVGLRHVSPEVLEAAVSNGVGRSRLLFDVRLPMAAPSIRAGLNQTIMYAIAMATMAAMIGAAGLGAPVWNGLTRLAFGDALEAGIGLVLIAILLDRVSAPQSSRSRGSKSRWWRRRPGSRVGTPTPRAGVAIAGFLGVVIASQVFRSPWQNFADPPWGKLVSLRDPVDSVIFWANTTWGPAFDTFRDTIQLFGLNLLGSFFAAIPWFVVVLATVVLGKMVGGWRTAVLMGLGVMAIGALGMWQSTVETLAVTFTAIVLVIIVGFALGVLMSSSDRAAAVIRPVLDVMQTLPVYLFVIPAVIFLGTGEVAGVIATFIAAVPPMIRFTNAALRGTDPEVVEAATTFGATPRQVLWQIRVPLGLPTIMVGLNQAVLLALAMSVVSAFIGAPGLGQDILASVQLYDLARGLEAGLAMLLLALIIDRLLRGSARMLTTATHTSTSRGKAEG